MLYAVTEKHNKNRRDQVSLDILSSGYSKRGDQRAANPARGSTTESEGSVFFSAIVAY